MSKKYITDKLEVSSLEWSNDSVSALVQDEVLGVDSITNGDFEDGSTSWSASAQIVFQSGYVNMLSSDGSYQYLLQGTAVTSGIKALMTYTVLKNTTGGLKFSDGTNSYGSLESSVGTHQVTFTSQGTSLYIERDNLVNSGVIDIDITDISIKEVTGTSEIQKRELSSIAFPSPNLDWNTNSVSALVQESIFGAELVNNGGFDSGTNWTLSANAVIDSGLAKLTVTSGASVYVFQSGLTLTASKTYLINFIFNPSVDDMEMAYCDSTGNNVAGTPVFTEAGSYSTDFTPTTTISHFGFKRNVGTVDGVLRVDNLSIREITGSSTIQKRELGSSAFEDIVWEVNSVGINYSDGNVGIGNTTPAEKLDVTGNITADSFIPASGNMVVSDVVSEPTGSDNVLNIVSLTQAEFDAGTPVATTIYNITDA